MDSVLTNEILSFSWLPLLLQRLTKSYPLKRWSTCPAFAQLWDQPGGDVISQSLGSPFTNKANVEWPPPSVTKLLQAWWPIGQTLLVIFGSNGSLKTEAFNTCSLPPIQLLSFLLPITPFSRGEDLRLWLELDLTRAPPFILTWLSFPSLRHRNRHRNYLQTAFNTCSNLLQLDFWVEPKA